MAQVKSGDNVKIIKREVTPEDTKSGLYYSFFGDLIGKVDRVYDDGSVSVDIDINSLTRDMREMHLGIQEAEHKRWLDNLSEEMRRRLTKEQKQLTMSYMVLVGVKDLVPYNGPKPIADDCSKDEGEQKRLSSADLDAAEEDFLKSRNKQ